VRKKSDSWGRPGVKKKTKTTKSKERATTHRKVGHGAHPALLCGKIQVLVINQIQQRRNVKFAGRSGSNGKWNFRKRVKKKKKKNKRRTQANWGKKKKRKKKGGG